MVRHKVPYDISNVFVYRASDSEDLEYLEDSETIVAGINYGLLAHL